MLVNSHSERHLLPLPELARVLGVHARTLRKAARDGRLAVTYGTRLFFGKPMARATLAAGEAFKRTYYRQTTRWNRPPPPAPPPVVPDDYPARLLRLRRRLRLTQTQLAMKIGAASKAVVYQWESRKRTPSPLFWKYVEDLEASTSHNVVQTPAATDVPQGENAWPDGCAGRLRN